MTDVAAVRRRRWERFATDAGESNSAGTKSDEDEGGAIKAQASSIVDDQDDGDINSVDSGAIPSEFECILCLRLYYEPVSLPCGHTYCRGCLKRALASKSQCPMCRAACHGGAGDCGTNLAMVSIIKSQFGEQYDARERETEQDAITEAEARRRALTLGESVTPSPDGSASMPVCLLDVLLFPHQPVTLYLFEPRYITLVNRCLSGTRRFAVFPDHTPATGASGSILEISDARMMHGGQYLVMCRGVGRCTSAAEFEAEEGTRGLRYARVCPFEDDDEAVPGSSGGTRTADEALGSELRHRADRTAEVVANCLARLSTRQRIELIRRCGEPPKVGNSSLSNYRKLSFWLPSALALSGVTAGGAAFGPTSTIASGGVGARVGATDGRERRAAMFRSRSLRQRLSEACQAVMESEAVMGSTSRRRERGLRRLFAASGPGAGGRGRGHGFFSATSHSVCLIVGIFAAMIAYQRYVKI